VIQDLISTGEPPDSVAILNKPFGDLTASADRATLLMPCPLQAGLVQMPTRLRQTNDDFEGIGNLLISYNWPPIA
jgi:hypothetical protein